MLLGILLYICCVIPYAPWYEGLPSISTGNRYALQASHEVGKLQQLWQEQGAMPSCDDLCRLFR